MGRIHLAKYWMRFQAFLAVVQVIVIIVYQDFILYTQDIIGMSSDCTKLLTTFGSYFIATYVSWKSIDSRSIFYHQKRLRILMDKLYVNTDRVHERLHKDYSRELMILVTLQTVALIEEMIFFMEEPHPKRFNYAIAVPTILVT